MNIPLLLKVKAAILAEPRKFDMGSYFKDDPECGTMACIAGHALVQSGKVKDIKDGWEKTADCPLSWEHDNAVKLMRITTDQATRLFYDSDWPSEFANRYRNCKTPRGRAKVAADRIDRFIESEGRV